MVFMSHASRRQLILGSQRGSSKQRVLQYKMLSQQT